VDRTRALAVDAAQAKDQGVVWLVGGIGIVGIALMPRSTCCCSRPPDSAAQG
jgi:hypothetical protein